MELQTFRAMNTTVTAEGISEDLAAWFAAVEQSLSRFDPESALSRLNRLSGRWVLVEPLLYRAIAAALQAARLTGGAFDPTVLSALEAAGYARSFELGPTPAASPAPAGRWREVKLEPTQNAVFLPNGVRLDLGGIGKGMAVDLAMARQPRPAPKTHQFIDAGGDIAIRTGPGAPPVLVDVEDPHRPDRTLCTFALRRGAVATSSALGRRWGAGLHHIINPATGRPADSDVVAATVIAPSAAKAEVLAKACIVLGTRKALDLLAANGSQGLLVTEAKETILTPGLKGRNCA